MINKLIAWLTAHRAVNILLVVLYTCVILFLHNTFVQCSIMVMNKLGLEAYNFWVKGISIVALLVILCILIYQLYVNSKQRIIKAVFLFSTLGFIVLHASIMFEMNIEIIHSLEFSVLAFLLFPFSHRVGGAVIMALPFMLLDEFNQYLILYPNYTQYFELNDVLMDTLGSGFLLIMLNMAGVTIGKSNKPLFKLPELQLLFVVMIFFVVAIATCFFSVDNAHKCTNTILSLNKLPHPDSFWQVHSFTKAVYHVMNPFEGLALITGMGLYFVSYDRLVGRK